MKVNYISAYSAVPSKAASSFHVMKMCDAYLNNNIEVTLFVSNNGDSSMLNGESIKNIYSIENKFKIKRLPVNYLSKFQKLFSLSILFPFYAFFNRSSLVHSRTLISAYVLSKIFCQPVIFELHDAVWKNNKSKFFFKSLVRSKNCKFLISITSALANDAISIIGNSKPILILPDGVSQKSLNTINDKYDSRKRLGLNRDDYIVLYSGHLYRGRGIDLIINLSEKLPNFKFILLGGNDLDINYYQEITTNLKNIEFLGFKTQDILIEFLNASDALLMPYENKVNVAGINDSDTSKYASPLKMFEYMATGRPIISSTLNVLSEILHHNYNALMVPYDDVNGWVNALELLKNNPEIGKRIADQAKEDVWQYTWEERVKKIMRFYNSVNDAK
ncbi:glycosyltransferase family 4 protein [Belliella pelovolcani]|uniref:Glycosyltransferase involved in cell wall bisynthesis n=1 Tax=Belliella pelovolcani TaxID=529505 RepID=A0A1N7KWJ9_9BACT|nr:glycosyltransferase family 4 protein [Belliella pelovolcani]SIS65790.1 Glycosyltransferase involved in cell wall bisynthesis [Belliella pelovolcani]